MKRCAFHVCIQLSILSILIWPSTNARVLKTLEYYESLRVNAKSVSRIQNIDLAENGDNTTTPFCHFAMVMPFSRFTPERTPVDLGVMQGMATVLMAVEHLNTGNGTLVDKVEGLDQRCSIKFTAEIFDSSYSQSEAVDKIITLISRQHGLQQIPTAFLGARWSSVSIPTSTVSGLKGYPQLSPISTSAKLDDKSLFPLFGRPIPSDAATSVPAIKYLRYELGVKHLAIVHVNDAYGDAYALGLQAAAAEYAPDMNIQSYSFEFDMTEDIARRTVTLLKQTNYHYFFGIFFSNVHYAPFMTEAYRQGIAGTGKHFWMFSDSVSPVFFDANTFEINSPLHLASRGASRIGAVAGVPGNENFDSFFDSVEEMNNPEDISLIQSKHPTYDDPEYVPLQIKDDTEAFFAGFSTSTLVPFLYDATIALGLAACEATQDDSFFDGRTHFEEYKRTTFYGATGNNTYDSETGSRLASSATFTLINIVEEESQSTKTETVELQTVVSQVFRDGEWQQIRPMQFNDGTSKPPADLPAANLNENFIGAAFRGAGVAMAAILISLSIYFFVWTYKNQATKVVKASQPIFLYLICCGCFLMSLPTIFYSIDDQIASDDICSAFCVVTPWFFFLGWILSFSALFAKTKRVNKIFHNPVAFSRIKVTVWDVMKPVLALLVVTTFVLLLWTFLSPPTFTREISEVDQYGRTIESRGQCNYEESPPYAITLAVVILGTLFYTVQQAFVARNISTEFAESEFIFFVLVVIFLVSILGIPIVFLVEENPSARYFSVSSIVFLIDLSILLLIFVPKLRQRESEYRDKSSRQYDNFDNSNRISVTAGTRRVSISGISGIESNVVKDFLSDSSKSSGEINFDDDDDDDSGILILHHPKKVETLKQEINDLKQEIETLRKRKNRLQRVNEKIREENERNAHFDKKDKEEEIIET